MKKRNLFLQTAIASALVVFAVGAQAGVLTGTVAYATENFGPTATAATGIAPPPIVYTFNTPGGIVVNPQGVIYLYLRVAAGAFTTAPLVGQFATTTGLTVSAPTMSADLTTVRITLTNGNALGGNNITVGVGNTVTYTGIANAIGSVNTTLATAGGVVTAQGSVSTTGGATAVPSTGAGLPADLDNGLSNVLNFATARSGLTTSLIASSSFVGATAETQKIDLQATSPGSRFTTGVNSTNATVANLGSIAFTNVAATFGLDGTTLYSLLSNTTTLGGTVTGSFKTGSTATLTTDLACTAAIAAGSAGTLNAALTTFTFTGGTRPTTATPNYVCLTTPATTAAIPATTPVGSFTIAKALGTEAASTAAGNLLALNTNGQTYDVRSYVPLSVTGYTSFIRIINTGNIAGVIVSGQFINADGTSGTAFPLTTLAAGGSITMSSTDIQAIMGAPAGGVTARPRLRLTAPTNGLSVQSQLSNNASGVFTDFNGAQ